MRLAQPWVRTAQLLRNLIKERMNVNICKERQARYDVFV